MILVLYNLYVRASFLIDFSYGFKQKFKWHRYSFIKYEYVNVDYLNLGLFVIPPDRNKSLSDRNRAQFLAPIVSLDLGCPKFLA